MRLSHYANFAPILYVVATAGPAVAQEAGASMASTGAATTADESRHDPFEIGLYGGLMVLNGRANTPFDERIDQGGDDLGVVGFDAGLRLGYYPIEYLGLEGELGGVLTRTSDDVGANLGAVWLHLVAQIPLKGVTPFALVGGGVLGGECDPEGCSGAASGRDSDGALHFGVGVKVPIIDRLTARVDVRDNIVAGDHLPDLLVGVAYTFGGRSKPLPPPSDRDGDGLEDQVDACPDEPATTPDGCPVRDRDGDGLPDEVDQCPDEPSTLPDGCPDLDPDKDGILIGEDQCPEVTGVAPHGCPDRDPDNDGILGDADNCPNQPETKNGFEDADGCPDEVPEEVKRFTGVIEGIQFDFGKATIRPTSFSVLDEAVSALKTYPSLKLRISGHTDSVGSAERNKELSAQRAQAVADYLVDQGIAPDRLETVGHGPDQPVADNETEAGRQKNRRIEFEVIQ